jgi:hypothetical protein
LDELKKDYEVWEPNFSKAKLCAWT